jgi:chromosome partitioning protein
VGPEKLLSFVHLAISLMQTGNRVALVDIDPQGSLANWYSLREKKYGKGYTGVTFFTSSGWRLSATINQFKEKYDYILIDSPPHTETDSKAAIRIADLVLVPMQPSPTDLWATSLTLDFAQKEKKLVKIMLNRHNASSKMAKEIIANLDNLLESYLGNRVAFSSCFLQGMSVTELDPGSQAAHEVKQLTNEILSYLGKDN